jgi:Transposase DDE domain
VDEPLLWQVLEHNSATVAFGEYEAMLQKARWLLRHHRDVMLLADRGFANHQLIRWLRSGQWHYGVRLPCDVLVQGLRRYPTEVALMYLPLGEARLDRNVGLWLDGMHRTNLVLL